MELDPNVCYRIIQARDARFDGKFFIAVTTTGVYCRPICPARTPKRENVQFFLCAASAEAAGFRPCKRCRRRLLPARRPGTGPRQPLPRRCASWEADSWTSIPSSSSRTGSGSVSAMCGAFSWSTWALRRTPLRNPAARISPRACSVIRNSPLRTRRSARGSAASASSTTCFEAFSASLRARFEKPGNAPRGASSARRAFSESAQHVITLSLSYRPPLAWDQLISFLEKRAISGVEEVERSSYRRSISLGRAMGTFEIKPSRSGKNELDVALRGIEPAMLGRAVRRIRRMFDLDADPIAITGHLCRDARLAPLVNAVPGMRLPLTWEPFEAVVRAVIGQQISVAGAVTILGRIAEGHGRHIDGGGTIKRVFPTASDISRADVSGLGAPTSRARCLKEIARALIGNRLRLDGSQQPPKVESDLRSVPGIGPWSAQYISLRGLGEPDAFPESDLGILKALDELGYPADRSRRLEMIDRLSPWRGYAAIYLWHALARGG